MNINKVLILSPLLILSTLSHSFGYTGKCDPCDPEESRHYAIRVGDLLALREKNRELLKASSAGDLERVKELLSEGAEARVKNNEGMTPLHWAAHEGRAHVIEELVHAGGDLNARDKEGMTPLHWASVKGENEAVELLLNLGADINATDKHGETALHFAASFLQEDVVRLLIDRGVYIYKLSDDGYTAYHYAQRPQILRFSEKRERVLKLLEYR